MLGWVYVFSHPNIPKLVKIGQSSHDPEIRAAELYTTGLPGPFHVEYKGLFENYDQLERKVHYELSDCRFNSGREFFEIEPHVAIAKIISCASRPAVAQIFSEKLQQGVETFTKKQISEVVKPFSININWDEPNETQIVSFNCKHCSSYSEHRVNKRMRNSICMTCRWESEYR